VRTLLTATTYTMKIVSVLLTALAVAAAGPAEHRALAGASGSFRHDGVAIRFALRKLPPSTQPTRLRRGASPLEEREEALPSVERAKRWLFGSKEDDVDDARDKRFLFGSNENPDDADDALETALPAVAGVILLVKILKILIAVIASSGMSGDFNLLDGV